MSKLCSRNGLSNLLNKTKSWSHHCSYHRNWKNWNSEANYVYQLKSLEASVKAGDAIAGAMKEWMDKSCLEFVPQSNERAYLLIVNNDREV